MNDPTNGKSSAWVMRFTAALAVLCGGREPPAEAVREWLDKDLDSFALQEWAIDNTALEWAQGIAVIDAAHTLADQPVEDAGVPSP